MAYSIVLADPPWTYRNTATRGAAEGHYSTMTMANLMEMPLPEIEDDAVLFLWATSPLLPDALAVMKSWGFRYKSSMVWDKDKLLLGNWFRIQHELLLLGVRGHHECPAPDARFPSVIRSRPGRHSSKPFVVHDMIERMFPGEKRIELFARERKILWDVHGNEAPTHTTRMI